MINNIYAAQGHFDLSVQIPSGKWRIRGKGKIAFRHPLLLRVKYDEVSRTVRLNPAAGQVVEPGRIDSHFLKQLHHGQVARTHQRSDARASEVSSPVIPLGAAVMERSFSSML